MGWFGRLRHRDDRGLALVEAAIVMPLLMMMTVGIWATARAWNIHNTLDHAAREAARFGATEVPWNDGPNTPTCGAATSEEAVRCIADQELQASAIAAADVTSICIEKADAGNNPCGLGITGTPQVAVVLEWQNYQLDFVFFSIGIDMNASGIVRVAFWPSWWQPTQPLLRMMFA